MVVNGALGSVSSNDFYSGHMLDFWFHIHSLPRLIGMSERGIGTNEAQARGPEEPLSHQQEGPPNEAGRQGSIEDLEGAAIEVGTQPLAPGCCGLACLHRRHAGPAQQVGCAPTPPPPCVSL